MFLTPDDKNLPNVPPLQLSVPADYPDQSPLWIDNRQQYGMKRREEMAFWVGGFGIYINQHNP